MSGWPRSRKRLLLAAMLLPIALVTAVWPLVGVLFVHRGGPDWAIQVTVGCFVGGFVIALVAALTCVADAAIDRRVRCPSARAAWSIALVLAPAVAPPAYWWLHVRPPPGEPHGLEILPPARAWSPRAKVATGAGALGVLVLMVGWGAWFATFFTGAGHGAGLAVPVFAAFGLLVALSCAVLALFLLDALREGGTHALLWAVLLVFAWPLAAPLYWLLYVRSTAPSGGGP